MNKFICVENVLLNDQNLTQDGIAVYCLLKLNIDPELNYDFFNTTVLAIRLGNGKYNREFQQVIRNGLAELQEAKYIKVEELDKNCKKITINSKGNKDGSYFTIIRTDHFLKLFSIKRSERISYFKLFRLYLEILATRNMSKNIEEKYRGHICNRYQGVLAKKCDINIKTVRKYIAILKSEKLIAVAYTCGEFNKELEAESMACLYSSYEDIYLLYEYVDKHLNGHINENYMTNRNYSIKMSKLYKKIVQDGKLYPYDVLMEVLYFCQEKVDKDESTKFDIPLLTERIDDACLFDEEIADQREIFDSLYDHQTNYESDTVGYRMDYPDTEYPF